MECIEDEPYITDMFTLALSHELVDDFTAYLKCLYTDGMEDWWFGAEYGDVIQELGDFVHYLMINPKTSPMTAEEIEMAREDAKKEALNFEKQEDLEVDDDEKPLLPLPPVHGHRMHGKGPGKRKAEQDTPEEEAWTVKWAPLTKNGVLDFLSYCSGQSWKPKTIDNSLSTQPPTVSPAKTIHNLKDSIKWKPIKPGQTLYVLDRIFCQERKNMRVLGLILFFCPCHPPVQSSKQSQDLHCLICSLRSKSARNLPDRMCALCPGFIHLDLTETCKIETLKTG